jgi:hypothetical protein
MPSFKADRRLYVTADKSECVEESDPRGAFLLAAPGREISAGAVEKYGLAVDRGGRILIGPKAKQAAKPEDKQAPKLEDKAAPKPKAKRKPGRPKKA